ncbi:hypothetical protein VTN77DRAFT_7906 [Rasamsonia byssochlamydoides]|uniref:uncharacterized protein n=1 Tax=Rasamsonia byssochlamydoides TaxID=89139 RepID=UPI0037444A5B
MLRGGTGLVISSSLSLLIRLRPHLIAALGTAFKVVRTCISTSVLDLKDRSTITVSPRIFLVVALFHTAFTLPIRSLLT